MIVAFVVYPYLKRFTPLCHLWLGVVDGLAPVGGWVAVTGDFDLAAVAARRRRRLLDRGLRHHLRDDGHRASTARRACTRCRPTTASPARSAISRALHALSVVALAGVGLVARPRPGLRRSASSRSPLLLAYEQQLVSPDDLSRVDMAFLSVNGVIALLYLGTVALDVAVS